MTDSISVAQEQFKRLQSILDLPKESIDEALRLISVYDKDRKKGRHGMRDEAFAVAIIFFALGKSRPLRSLCRETNVKESAVISYISKIQTVIPETKTSVSTIDLITKYISEVNGNVVLELVSKEICKRLYGHTCGPVCSYYSFHEKKKTALAATIVYMANYYTGRGISDESILKVSKVSLSAIRLTQKIIQKHWDSMFENEKDLFVFQRCKDHANIIEKIKI